MGRGIMMRWACAVAGVAMVVSGCSCPPVNPPVDCTDSTITFETPTAGQTVDSPFDVSIVAKGPDGGRFDFEAATLSVNGTSFTGTVSGNRATFTGIASAPGEVGLTASIAQGSCSKSSPVQVITVRDTCSTPAVTAVEFPQDTGGLGVLNRTELPDGTFLQVKVTAMCVPDVQVRIMRGTTVVGPLTPFVNGVATVTTTLPDSDNARYDLFAELVRNGAAVNTPTGNPAASGSILVSRALPACAVSTTGSFGPNDDADQNTAGFQMRVTGTMDSTSSGTLALNGQTPVGVTPSMTGDVSADFTLTTSGMYTATLTCTDGNGNTNTATGSFSVDFDPPTLSIVSPPNVDGGATMVVTQSPLSVRIVTDAPDNSLAEIFRNGVSVGTAVVLNGMATLAVPFGADGTYTIAVHVTDPAGNEAVASIEVTVALSGCGAAFVRPSTCPALITPAQMSSGAYLFQTSSKPVCSGQGAALFKADVLADGGIGGATQVATTSVGGSGAAGFPPVALSSGDYVVRAEVTNVGVDAGVSSTECYVTVDLDGPVITSPVLIAPPYAILNIAQDSQPSVPGIQRVLSFSARVPPGGRIDVCTTQAVDPVTNQARVPTAECSAGGAGWYPLKQGVVSPASGFTFPNGSYQIKIVVVGGGLVVPPESAPVALLVDDTRPCVNGLSRLLPQDGTNGGAVDLHLNIAELAGAGPTLKFSLGCGDSSPADLSLTTPVVIRDVVTGAPGAARSATPTFAAGNYTLALTPATSEAHLELFVELTDLAGNKNLFLASGDPGIFDFHVDPVAPACDIQSPSASVTLVGQSGAPGGMFPVVVATSSDVTNGVLVTFGTQTPRTLIATAGVAQDTFTVTGTNSYAINATCTDQSGNSTPATARNVTIDLDAPTCAITSPQATTYSTNPIATSISVGGAEGRAVTVRSNLAGSPLSTSMIVSGGAATANLTYPNGTQTVTAEVSDLAGNLCTASVANVIVNTTGCGLTLSNVVSNAAGNWFNRSNTGSLGATSGVISAVLANSADCRAGQAVTLQRTAPTTGAVLNATTATSGDVSFPNVAVNDGETWVMTINNGTGILTPQTFRVGLIAPTAGAVTINGNTVTSGQNVYFVANSGNINLDPADGPIKATTYFADQNANVADGSQTTMAVNAVSGAQFGTDNGRLDILIGSTVALTQPIATEPFSLPATQVTLAHNASGAFVVRVTSASGNTLDVVTNPAVVDVQPPSAPNAGAPTITASRAATASLTWSPVFDDAQLMAGSLTGGPVSQVAGYDVRWTTDLVTNGTGIPDTTTYFTRALVNPESVVPWQATAITHPLTLPPINNYFVSVRARDDVGNYSAFAVPTRVTNRGTEDVILNPTAVGAQRFGGTLAGPDIRSGADAGIGFGIGIGSVNDDFIDDLVIASASKTIIADGGSLLPDAGLQPSGTSLANAGSVYVYFGRAGFGATSSCAAPQCQEIVPYQSTASAFFGLETAVGNVDSVNTDPTSRLDLIVTAIGYDANRGRVLMYFGSSASGLIDTSTLVEFRGQDYGSRLGGFAKVVPDINNDGYNELLISSRSDPVTGTNAGQGMLYLYFGRARSAWATLMTSTDLVTNRPYVRVSAATADRVLEGPLPVNNSGSTSNLFGSTRGVFAPLGDLDADGRQDFVVAANKNNLNRAYLYSGAAVSSAVAPVPAPALFVDEPDKGTTGTGNGFGTRVIGGFNILGSSLPDLIATQARLAGGTPAVAAACNVKVFVDGTSTGYGAASVTITGSSTRQFGFWAEATDVNGDSRVDLMVGEGGSASTNAWVFFQRSDQTFDGTAGSGFWQASFAGPATGRRGGSMAYGDFDNDGRVDIAIGDELDAPGRVIVWH